MEGENADAIKAKTDALIQALMKVGEALYKAAAEQGGAQAGGAGDAGAQADAGGAQASNDEKVVDADFEEVDERKGKSA